MSATLTLAGQLIARRSITPQDDGCLDIIGARLAACGFAVEQLRFGEVSNLWARRGGGAPLFVFAGHTDVVPPGPREQWTSDPFEPALRDGWLYGRGAADMKGSLAAMVTATEAFLAGEPGHEGAIGFLLTSDEEGPAVDGTRRVLEQLAARGERIDWCLVGEPSCDARFGDTIRNGRRGSLNGRLRVRGVQGHVAYPDRVRNPIHLALPALAELAATRWDQGNAFFPATSFQISNIAAGTGAENVVPGELSAWFNFRFCTESTPQDLQARVAQLLRARGLDFSIDWQLSGAPFLTAGGALLQACTAAIHNVTGVTPALSTGGGTSDGRFIATTGAEVIEFGPGNRTIHKIDECVRVSELDALHEVYLQVLRQLLGHPRQR